MHSPESTQELAHVREALGPSPVRTMSSTPATVARGSASAMPAAGVIGQASKHLPHLVQASSIQPFRYLGLEGIRSFDPGASLWDLQAEDAFINFRILDQICCAPMGVSESPRSLNVSASMS
jgi:hypothetical protein